MPPTYYQNILEENIYTTWENRLAEIIMESLLLMNIFFQCVLLIQLSILNTSGLQLSYVHPSEKVIGIFLQNRIWSRLLDINKLCLIYIKRSIEEIQRCQISRRGYQQGASDETLKKARCQFCDIKFVTELCRRWIYLTIKCAILLKLQLMSQPGVVGMFFMIFRYYCS